MVGFSRSAETFVTLAEHKDEMVATLAKSMLVLVHHIENLERQLQDARASSRDVTRADPLDEVAAAVTAQIIKKKPHPSRGPTFLRYPRAEAVG